MAALPFLLREALINLRRHGLMTVAAVTTITVALTLIGTFGLGSYQLDALSRQTVGAFEMRVFCRTELTPEQVQAVETRLKALPQLSSVTYRSRDDAFADATRNLPIDAAGLPNLMPDTFVLKLTDPRQAGGVAATVRGWHGEVAHVELPEEEMSVVVRLTDFLRTLSIANGAMLLLGALVVVINTIQLSVFARRREIQIMQIVGATPRFIRLPMLLEGVLHGLGGGALAGVNLVLLLRYIHQLTQKIPLLANNAQPVSLPIVCVLLLLGGALLGGGGAAVSLHRYLRDIR